MQQKTLQNEVTIKGNIILIKVRQLLSLWVVMMLTKETIWRLTFTDNYSSVLDELSTDDCRIITSGLLPRGSVDLEPYNARLKTLCAEKGKVLTIYI